MKIIIFLKVVYLSSAIFCFSYSVRFIVLNFNILLKNSIFNILILFIYHFLYKKAEKGEKRKKKLKKGKKKEKQKENKKKINIWYALL